MQLGMQSIQLKKGKPKKRPVLSSGFFLTSILAFSQTGFWRGWYPRRILYPLDDTSRAQPHQYCETNYLAWIYKQLCSVLSSQKFFLLQTGFSSYLCFDNEFLPSLVSGPPVSGEFEFYLCILLG
jgi:hypothetical protein